MRGAGPVPWAWRGLSTRQLEAQLGLGARRRACGEGTPREEGGGSSRSPPGGRAAGWGGPCRLRWGRGRWAWPAAPLRGEGCRALAAPPHPPPPGRSEAKRLEVGGSGPCWWVQERDAPAGLQRSGAPLPALPISPPLRPEHPLEGIEHLLPQPAPRAPAPAAPSPPLPAASLTLFLEVAGALHSTRCALGTTDSVGRGAWGGGTGLGPRGRPARNPARIPPRGRCYRNRATKG